MSFFDSLENARSLPEDKKLGVALVISLCGTGLIFSGWLFFMFGQPVSRVPEPLAAATAHHEGESGPSPAELLVAGFKASHDNLLEHTTGLREMLGDGFTSLGIGSGSDQDSSLVESGDPSQSQSRATTERIDQPSSSQSSVIGGNLSDAEKEAILDEYFNNAKASRSQDSSANTDGTSGGTQYPDAYPTAP